MKNMSNEDLNRIARQNNIDINELKRAADSGNVNDFIDKQLSHDAAQKVKNILSDKDATKNLLSTPQARELLNKLLER